MRALVIGTVASFKDCWTFRRNLAKQVGCSVRTVQRALTQARAEGLIGVARAKKTEVPPNWQHGPITCGWSHRWTIGWGQAAKVVQAAVEQAKARWFVRHSMPQARPSGPARSTMDQPARPSRPEFQRKMTAEEIDRELARLDAERLHKPPPS